MYKTGLILVTLEELSDSFFSIDRFVQDIFGQRLCRGLAKNVSQGSLSGGYASYLADAVSGATSVSGAFIEYADIVALWNTLGRPIFIPSPSSGAFDPLLGRPVVLDQVPSKHRTRIPRASSLETSRQAEHYGVSVKSR
jgi:hypothetical protein